ncbi:MAG TPA: ATP-binding protein [Gemmataceae bacterium]|nr:ATP-binding protein [Gemmataceae bacterium]
MTARLIVRMTAPLLVISGLLLAVGVGTAWYVQRLQKNASEVLTLNVASMRAAEELEIGLREVRNQLDRFLLTRDRKYLERAFALRQETDHWLEEAERLATTPQEARMMAAVKQGYEHLFQELDHISQQASAEGLPPERMGELIDEVLTSEIIKPAHEYLDFNEYQATSATQRNQSLADRMVLGLLLLGICGPGAGLLAGFSIARRVSRSIVRLSLPIRDAAGKLNEVVGPVTLSAGWSLDELEGVLCRMAEQIGAVIEQMQQSQREALRAEQLAAVGQLAAGLAHELRNPLMSMKILVQAAAERGDPASLGSRGLRVLEEEIIRLERLTRTFLDFARPPRPEKQTFEARALLEQTVAFLAGRASQRDVQLDCRLPDHPVWMEADMGQVRQVLLNLLLNALDAVPDGGTVRVELEVPEGPDGEGRDRRWLVLRVADTGHGLPAGLGQGIFTPFVSTKGTGMGLGLSVCKRIVEAHGGEITAADRPGGGAVFSVRLPCLCENSSFVVRH